MYSLRFKNELPAIVAKELESFLTALKGWIAVDHNEDGTHHVAPTGIEVPVGGTIQWPSSTIPAKWLLCDGTAYSRTDYRGLFDVIGTTYGSGDGSTTFNVPNLQQRFPMGKAASGTGVTLGSTGGAIDHTHSLSGGTTGSGGGFSTSTGSGGGHSHSLTGTAAAPGGGASTASGGPSPPFFSSMDDHTHSVTGSTDTASDHTHSISVGDHTHSMSGGSSSTNNPPYLVVNFIICAGV